jgi:hypothetical protein
MKPLYLCIFLVATFSSCFLWKPSAEKVRRQAVKDSIVADKACMDSLKAFVARNWHFNSGTNLYEPNDSLMQVLGQRCIQVEGTDSIALFTECLKSMNIIEAEKIFGKANERGAWSLKYYFNQGCHSKNGSECSFMNLTFDNPSHTLRCVFIW